MGNNEPIIGLKHVTEIITEANDKRSYIYKCDLCATQGQASKMVGHVVTAEHRKNYIKKYNLEEVPDKELSKRAAAIELVHGRGEWIVKKEVKGFQKMDKSAFLAKPKKRAAGADVEMADLDEAPKKKNLLRPGEVVVEELQLVDSDDEEEGDPKFYVLQCFDELLEKDFSIKTDIEAMMVDSIIKKLDKALFDFVNKDKKPGDENGSQEKEAAAVLEVPQEQSAKEAPEEESASVLVEPLATTSIE